MPKALTQEEFETRAKQVHDDTYDYSLVKYVRNDIKVIIVCNIHGPFEQRPNNHLHGQGCKKCEDDRRTYSNDDYIAKCSEVHGIGTYDYSKTVYHGALEKLIVSCRVHGDFMVKASHHLEGHGCARCVYEYKRYSNDEYIAKASTVHDGKYDYSLVNYTGHEDIVTIICPNHGAFKQQAYIHLFGHGCANCTHRSSISNVGTEWLNSLGIPNDNSHREVRLLGKKVDGYDSYTNTVYEFYGDYWHGNPNVYSHNDIHPVKKITYGELYNETIERERLLIRSGFRLVSIWESDWRLQCRQDKLSSV